VNLRRYLRLVRMSANARRPPTIGIHDVARWQDRVWPGDLDELRHVNNGVYLSMMDLPRLDLLQRSGFWSRLQREGVYPVVASQTVTYRKSMTLWQRFTIESRIAGYDERAVFIEQRFVVDGEIYARAIVKGRFLRRSGGTVTIAQLAELTGIDTASLPVPAWMTEWSDRVALPSTRSPAPSEWDA
jgi:YbgC/YbaW family acyl-CoA thioester hydrolase